MQITRNTTVREVIDSDSASLEIFDKHGVCVEHECPDGVLDFQIEDCEDMCHIDDIDELVRDLNEYFENKVA